MSSYVVHTKYVRHREWLAIHGCDLSEALTYNLWRRLAARLTSKRRYLVMLEGKEVGYVCGLVAIGEVLAVQYVVPKGLRNVVAEVRQTCDTDFVPNGIVVVLKPDPALLLMRARAVAFVRRALLVDPI